MGIIPGHLVIGGLVEELAAAGSRPVEGGAATIFILDATGAIAVVSLRGRNSVPIDMRERGVLLQEDGGEESMIHVDLGGVDDRLGGDEAGGDLSLLLLFHPGALAFGRFLFE